MIDFPVTYDPRPLEDQIAALHAETREHCEFCVGSGLICGFCESPSALCTCGSPDHGMCGGCLGTGDA